MKCVAPHNLAGASFAGFVSTAMIGRQSESASAWSTLRPMPPSPMTTADWPCVGLARLNTAPAPVSTAHPMRLADASGTSGSMTTAWVSVTTVYSENTPAFANWNAFSPPTVNGAFSLPGPVSRQWVGWPRSHASHWPQLPRVVRTTWSPTFTLVTASPTASTTPAPSWPRTTGVGNGIVPSITLTSLWQRPAAWMRTLTSCGRGSRTSTSSRTSSAPVQTMAFTGFPLGCSCRSSGPDDRLHLAVGVQTPGAAVSADAALLEAAEGRLVVALRGVDPDVAGTQPLRARHRLRGVLREHVVVQAVVGAVRQRDGLLVVVEGEHDDDGTEDLLLHRLHAGLRVGDERGRDVEAGVDVRAVTAGHCGGAVVERRAHVALDPLAVGAGDDGTDDGVALEWVTDLQHLRHAGELADQLVDDRRVRDHARGRGADLAGVERPHAADRAHRGGDVRVAEYDGRALATELEEQALHAAPGDL